MLRGMGLLATIFLLFLSACGENSSNEASNQVSETPEYSPFDVNMYPPQKTVCDPFTDNQQNSNEYYRGIRADLYTVGEGERYTKVQDYIDNGVKSPRVIFLSDLNVRTRKFDMGFVNHLGQALRDDNDEVLIEDFALSMRTVFRLRDDQPSGKYEFAILSDDGATWEYRDRDGVYKELVDNDGQTPTRMGCSSVALDLQEGQSVLMNLKYYQGPRYHIAMVAMMRKIPDGEEPGKDPLCGQAGNRKFFDYDNNSEPQQAYRDLESRGWEVLKPRNFELPLVFSFNPCNQGERPDIYDVAEKAIGEDRYITWKTNKKSTSQLVYTNQTTGETYTSTSDNIMRTEHQVKIDTLSGSGGSQKASGAYSIQPMSVSNTLGRSLGSGLDYQL